MGDVFITINIFFVFIIWLWAFYKLHISKRFINRLAFSFITLGATVMLITFFVPNESRLYWQDYKNFIVWQRLLFNAAWTFFCFADLYCNYGSEKWHDAFKTARESKKVSQNTQKI